jgi:hypothetical protein
VKFGFLATILMITGSLWSCGDSSGPVIPERPDAVTVTDPTGDTFGSDTAQIDLTAMTITRDSGGVTIVLDFVKDVVHPESNAPNALRAYVDFDTDQDSATGVSSVVDDVTGIATAMGVDYELDMFLLVPPDSSALVTDSLGDPTGVVKLAVSGKRLTVRVPLALLGGDDGFLNAAVIVGTPGERTDIAPNGGHLRLGGTGTVAPLRPGT